MAAVALGRRRLTFHHDVEVAAPRAATPQPAPASQPVTPLQDIRSRLGAAEAEVRLSGLRDWVAYGEADVSHRQPALDVLCETLRALPWPGTEVDRRWRMILQATLLAHLRPGPGFWLDCDLDLRHTTLVDFDLSHCRLRGARFDGTRFLGDTRFDQTAFLGDVTARGAFFARHVLFTGSVFARGLDLRRTAWRGNGELSGIHVAGPAALRGARFGGRADFTCARFGSDLDCSGTLFAGRAVFRRAWFAGDASFAGSWFRGREDFVEAVFGGESSFENTRFGHRVHAD
ncbi:Pentapeptide repeat-containing protein [Lentzea xinjiangensis]|uniref:Pentapeptide repeat-containing protein n=1 Tax=Lentzea xinjiangensis TaxID=402600 RepID=A0A1H9KWC8_9PSEU|nr:Pentapeptide repeat-containing protein [Lentzea xinjiangensis]